MFKKCVCVCVQLGLYVHGIYFFVQIARIHTWPSNLQPTFGWVIYIGLNFLMDELKLISWKGLLERLTDNNYKVTSLVPESVGA